MPTGAELSIPEKPGEIFVHSARCSLDTLEKSEEVFYIVVNECKSSALNIQVVTLSSAYLRKFRHTWCHVVK
jgi:hypothetical protein